MVTPDNLRPISPTPSGLAVLREWNTSALESLVAECNKILGERAESPSVERVESPSVDTFLTEAFYIGMRTATKYPSQHGIRLRIEWRNGMPDMTTYWVPPMVPEEV